MKKELNKTVAAPETVARDFDVYRNTTGHKLYLVVEGKQKLLDAGAEMRALISLREELKRFAGELMRVTND